MYGFSALLFAKNNAEMQLKFFEVLMVMEVKVFEVHQRRGMLEIALADGGDYTKSPPLIHKPYFF